MKRLNLIVIIMFAMGVLFTTGFAETKKDKNIRPNGPIVTTWSKIKELFE